MILKLLFDPVLPRILMYRCFVYSSFETPLELILLFKCLKSFSDNFRMFIVQFDQLRRQYKILVDLGLILFEDNLLHAPGRVMPVKQLG